MKLTATQSRLVDLMRSGHILNWNGYAGPELSGFPFWPQKRTVRTLLKAGVLVWGEYRNQPQREAGICPIVLAETS